MTLEPVFLWLFPLAGGLALMLIATAVVRETRRAPSPGKCILILGTGPLAREIVGAIASHPDDSYCIVGVVAERLDNELRLPNMPVVGTLDELQDIISRLKPGRIIVALNERRQQLPVHQLMEARVSRRILVEDGEEFYERLAGKLAIESLKPSNVIFSRDFRPSVLTLTMARCLSVAAAATGLIVLAPVLVLIAVMIKLDSRGPVLFVQERAGLGGTRFDLFKFRTMHPQKPKRSEWVRDNRDCITRVGKWLRKYRLDELPQFINILQGDMNLVGPRPHPASNIDLFTLVSRNTPSCGEQIPYYSLRSMVRPGITGWAQVRYRYANDLDEEIEKLRYDLHYIKHFSIGLDLRILVDTVKIVIRGHETEESDEKRNDAPGANEYQWCSNESFATDDSPRLGIVAAMSLQANGRSRAFGSARDDERWAMKEATLRQGRIR